MEKRRGLTFNLLFVLMLIAPQSLGLPTFDLVSTPSNLSAVYVGNTITVRVTVSGLSPGDELEFLACTLSYDHTLVSGSSPSPGAVIPDVAGFNAVTTPGIADGLFDSLLTASGFDVITSNGDFYEITLTGLTPGTGSVAFTFSDALGSTGSSTPIDGISLSTPSLAFTIVEPLPADLDGDGDVDGVDISGFFSNFTGPGGGPPGNPDADLDDDGDVDGVDISGAFAAFTGPLQPASVPEPSASLLLIVAFAFVSRRLKQVQREEVR